MIGRGLAVVLLVLAIARHDLWWWDDPTRVLGLPVGLTYHVAFCLVVAVVLFVATRAKSRGGETGGNAGARP